jgi:hypothetical protein
MPAFSSCSAVFCMVVVLWAAGAGANGVGFFAFADNMMLLFCKVLQLMELSSLR